MKTQKSAMMESESVSLEHGTTLFPMPTSLVVPRSYLIPSSIYYPRCPDLWTFPRFVAGLFDFSQ